MRVGFAIDVARGKFGPQMCCVSKIGHNLDIFTSWEHVWNAGGLYPFQTSPCAVRIKAGGNAADDASGIGARSVTIAGLDGNWDRVSETIATAGASASTYTTQTFIRVCKAYVASAGTYGDNNIGAITIENAAADVLAVIGADNGESATGLYSVPNGFKAFLLGLGLEMESNKVVSAQLLRRENADDVTGPDYSPLLLISEFGAQGSHHHEYEIPPEFPSKSDIIVRAKVLGVATAEVAIEYSLVLIANELLYDL